PADLAAIWRDEWGEFVVSKGHVIRPTDVEAFGLSDGGELLAVGSYQVTSESAEIVSLNAIVRGKGYGRQLLETMEHDLADRGVSRCWLITTNDNLHAISVYLRSGYRLVAV